MLTQEELMELLNYNEYTGVFTWIKRTANRIKVGDVAGSTTAKGYLCIMIKGVSYRNHNLAWLYVKGNMPKEILDHIDGDKKNNLISNLRDVSQSENTRNAKINKLNKSGTSGVYFNKINRTWMARISVNNNRIHLGSFKDKEDAINARKNAEYKYGYHENHGRSK